MREYARTLPEKGPFCGLSATPDAPERERLAVCENLIRDYAAGAGGALSTVPGFRAVAALSGAIHGIWAHGGALLVHAGTRLYRVTGENTATALTGTLADADSTAFEADGRFYLLDGARFQALSGSVLAPVPADPPAVEENGKAVASPSFLTTRTRRIWNVTEGAEPDVTPAAALSGSPAVYVGADSFVEAPQSAGRVDVGAYHGAPVSFLAVSGGEVVDGGGVGDIPPTLLLRAGTGDLTLTAGFATLTDRTKVYFDAAAGHKITVAAVPHFARGGPPELYFSCPVSGLNTVFDTPRSLRFLPPNVCIAPGVPYHTGIRSHLTGRVGGQYAAELVQSDEAPPVVEARAAAGHGAGRIGLYEDDGELVLEAGADFPETGDACVIYAARLEVTAGVFRDFFFNIAVSNAALPTAAYHFGVVCRPRAYPAAGTLLSATVGGEEVPFGTVYDALGAPLYAVAGCGATGTVELLFEHGETPAAFAGHDTVFAAWQGALPLTRRAVIDGCRYAAVTDGVAVLGGNPACPRLLFCGRGGDFRLLDAFPAPADVTGLYAAGDALYVLTADGVHRYRKGAGTGLVSWSFAHAGQTAVHPTGPCLSFGGEVLLPTREGVFGFRPSAADPLETLYPRGDAIGAPPVEGAAVFEGYAALFCRGRVFLADGRTARAGGTARWQYDWYPLSQVGVRYQKSGSVYYRTGRYHTLAEMPAAWAGKTLSVGGLPVLCLGETAVAAADVLTGTLSVDGVSAGTVLYTPTTGGCLLCDGPAEYDDAGDFYPARHPFTLSAAAGAGTAFFGTGAPELLFFGDATGHLYLVNTDKRAGGTLAARWYAFDGHRIRAGLLTGPDDGGSPGTVKNVRRGGLTVALRAMGGPPPVLHVIGDRGGDWHAAAGDAGLAFDGLDLTAPGFLPGGMRRVSPPLSPRRFRALSFSLSDGGFCAPFGVYFIHYGYTVAGRSKP